MDAEDLRFWLERIEELNDMRRG